LKLIVCFIVTVDLDQLGNKSLPVPAFDVQQKMDRIPDTAGDRLERQINAGLQHTTR
jgi:hypothetical protein